MTENALRPSRDETMARYMKGVVRVSEFTRDIPLLA